MKRQIKINLWIVSTLLLAFLRPVQAADADATPGIQLRDPEPLKRNQIGLNYWLGLNMAVDFKKLGGFPRQTDPGPATGGAINRTYDNGDNLVDSSGNKDRQTWNWGYEDSSQAYGNSRLVMDSSASFSQTRKNDVDEGATQGVELTYRRDLGSAYVGRWGVEGAFGYTGFSVENNSTLTTSFQRISDSYALEGVIPPLPPYQGSLEGPGPVISDRPMRGTRVVEGGAVVAGKREMECDLFAFRLGPYWEKSLSSRLAGSLSGGFAFAVVDSEFSFRESVSIHGAGTVSRSGSDTQTDVLLGAYLAGNISYALTDTLKAVAGAQWQYLGDNTQNGDGKSAVTDFDDAIFLTVGLGYSF